MSIGPGLLGLWGNNPTDQHRQRQMDFQRQQIEIQREMNRLYQEQAEQQLMVEIRAAITFMGWPDNYMLIKWVASEIKDSLECGKNISALDACEKIKSYFFPDDYVKPTQITEKDRLRAEFDKLSALK